MPLLVYYVTESLHIFCCYPVTFTQRELDNELNNNLLSYCTEIRVLTLYCLFIIIVYTILSYCIVSCEVAPSSLTCSYDISINLGSVYTQNGTYDNIMYNHFVTFTVQTRCCSNAVCLLHFSRFPVDWLMLHIEPRGI